MPDFANAKAVLSSGVYVLRNYGRVVWVGKAKNVAAKVYGHLAKPAKAFQRPMEFDDLDIRPCRVDQLDEVWEATCEELGWAAPQVAQFVTPMRRRA